MFLAKPQATFRLARHRVLTCQILRGNPNQQIGSDLTFLTVDGERKRIRIEGISTASHPQPDVFDLSISGDEIEQQDIGDASLISSDQVCEVGTPPPFAHARNET